MLKRVPVLLALLVLIVGVNGALAQVEVEIPDELPSGLTITYWHEWSGNQMATIEELVVLFNATNEFGITVEPNFIGTSGAVTEQVNAGIISGELPNITGDVFPDTAQSYFLDNVIVPLDAFIDHPVWGFSEEERADINFDLVNVNRIPGEPFGNQVLAWPVGQSANVLSVNLDMVEALNENGAIDFTGPPETLEQFRALACAANELTTEDGGDVMGFPIRSSGFDLYSFIRNQGGVVFDSEAQQYVFTDEPAIRTVQFFQDLFTNGCAYIPDGPFVNTADFAFGLNPMAVGSSVGVPFIQNDIEDSGSGIENWVNVTVPWNEGNREVQIFLRSLSLMVSTPEEQLASWLFIKFLASPEAQVIWTEGAQYQPYTGAGLRGLSDEFLSGNRQFNSLREVLLSETPIWAAPGHVGSRQVIEAVESALAAILTGGADVEEALADLEETANEILAENLAELS